MFRRYTISIEKTNSLVDLVGIEKELGCSISQPSNWVTYGSTKERGLTFLNKEGKELVSSVFLHQPYFRPLNINSGDEAEEIRVLVSNALFEHYSISRGDVNIEVEEYNRV